MIRHFLRKIFAPLLNIFEKGDGPYAYKGSHRAILIAVGIMFTGLSGFILYLAKGQDPSYYLPAAIFACVGIVTVVIGGLGSDRAVATIWGTRH